MPRPSANFYPRPPRGGRLYQDISQIHPYEFLSTPSARRATLRRKTLQDFYRISIHALREEGDIAVQHIFERDANFYPRPPRGGRPSWDRTTQLSGQFLSTPSARRATCKVRGWRNHEPISIHALREEGDRECAQGLTPAHSISIHALREEGDPVQRRDNQSGGISIHALREEGDATA